MEREIQQRLDAAVAIGREAGERTLPAFRSQQYGVELKVDGSEVTEVDRATEAWIRERVLEAFEDGVLGEEHGETAGTSGFRWVVDPIDGTISFVRGVPLYGTLVSVQRWGGDRPPHRPEAGASDGWESVVGVIAMPALGEMVYAGVGGGCWHVAADDSTPRPARVSGVRELGRATVCTTSLDYFAKCGRERAYERLGAACGMLRGWSDCYAHVLVATGRVEAAVEPSSINLWDVAGMPVIMSEAGGRYTDLQGRAGAHWKTGLSTNGFVHEALLEAMRGDGRSTG